MHLSRKRPIILKESPPQCPNCEAMGWHFSSADAALWPAFLEMAQIENVEELVFSQESVLHPEWKELEAKALQKGFRVSLWLCGHASHKHLQASEVLPLTENCKHLYPLVSDFKELYFVRDQWQLEMTPLFLIFHEQKRNISLKLFELELKQDLFPVWGVFPERNKKREIGIRSEVLHSLYFKTRAKRLGQGLSAAPGLEMMDLRVERKENLIPEKVEMYVGTPAPEFSLILPAFGDVEDICAVLEHILQLEEKNFEVVFVDEGNPQSLESVFASYVERGISGTFVRLGWSGKEEKAFRAGKARNIGAKYSRGKTLCFLDSDVLIPRTYLQEVRESLKLFDVVQATRLNLKPGVRNPSLHEDDLVPMSSYWRKFRASASKDWNIIKHPWKYICTHSLSLKKELFFDVGGFNSLFNSYGYEDTEFGYRCFMKGKKFGLLSSPIFHLERRSDHTAHKSSNLIRHRGLRRTGSLFMRNCWDHEVFTHCHYLFDASRSKWSRAQALGKDLVKTLAGRRNSVS